MNNMKKISLINDQISKSNSIALVKNETVNEFIDDHNLQEPIPFNYSNIHNDQMKHFDVNSSQHNTANLNPSTNISVRDIPVSDRIKNLIIFGDEDRYYASNSEADSAVINALVAKHFSLDYIRNVFIEYKIGTKYREHPDGESYLKNSYDNAINYQQNNVQTVPKYINSQKNKNGKSKLSLKPYNLFEHITSKHNILYDERDGSIYVYKNNHYQLQKEENINRLCQDELGKEYKRFFNPHDLKLIMHYIKGSVDSIFENKNNIISFQNGNLNLETDQFESHSPNVFNTSIKTYNYDEKAECPRFINYLKDVFCDDYEMVIKYVQEIIGYSLHNKLPIPAIFFFIGNGCNGKSVLLDVIELLHGKSCVSNVSIGNLSKEEYVVQLKGVSANLSHETPVNRNFDTELLKSIVAGENTMCRPLYGNPLTFKPTAKHYIAMNELPRINDTSNGMERRIYIIEFPRQFKDHEIDTGFFESLKPEISGIFNWAYTGFKRLKDNKFKFNVPESFRVKQKEILHEDSLVKDFIETYFDKTSNEDDRIVCLKLRKHYNSLTNEKMKTSHFKNILQSLGYKVDNSSKHNNKICVFGLKPKH